MYSLDQKGQVQSDQKTALGGNYSTHSNAGFHNSIFFNTATDKARIAEPLTSNATASGSLPVWAWITIGVSVAVGLLLWRHHKKK